MIPRLKMHKHTVPSWGQSSLWTSSGGAKLRLNLCVCVFVFVCRQQPCLTLWCTCSFFLRASVQSVRQVLPRSYLSHWLLSLSPSCLPLDMLSLQHWGYYSCHWRRKRGISLQLCSLLQRGCSKPQLLLQVNHGLKQTETRRAHRSALTMYCTLYFKKCMAFALLLYN